MTVRLYGSLGDFVRVAHRRTDLVCEFRGTRSVMDLLEGLGVPHTEIDLVLVNAEIVHARHLVRDGHRVAAYPLFERLDLGSAPRQLAPDPTVPRFVADVHLGRLAAYLRLAGFDTAYDPGRTDPEIVDIAESEGRIALTRDIGLLRHRRVRRGYFVRATSPARQLVEVLRRFDLPARAEPFSRCLACNERLGPVSATEVAARLPEGIAQRHNRFWRCARCHRVYWQGTHYERLRTLIETAFAAAEQAG